MHKWIIETELPIAKFLDSSHVHFVDDFKNFDLMNATVIRPSVANTDLPSYSENLRLNKLGENSFTVNSDFNAELFVNSGRYQRFRNEVIDFRLPPESTPGGLSENDVISSWATQRFSIQKLRELGLTGNGIRAGIIDTGLDFTHPAFTEQTRTGKVLAFAEFSENGDLALENKDETGYGIDGAMIGNQDPHWHGTHVASILAGGTLVDKPEGVAPGVNLIVGRALDKYNKGTVASIYSALLWIKQFQCDVVSLSLGWEGYRDHWAKPIRALLDSGTVVVAASGNEYGLSNFMPTRSPGNYPFLNDSSYTGFFISVGAIDKDNKVWKKSGGDEVNWPLYYTENDGSTREIFFSEISPYIVPTLVGPGVDIAAAAPERRYKIATGTSQATPFIAGLITLILESLRRTNINATPRAAAELLSRCLTDKGSVGQDERFGYGIPDIKTLLANL